MDVDELASMDDEAARNLMFPRPLSRSSWQSWKIPNPKLPIDDFIASLIPPDGSSGKPRAIALKSKSELASLPLRISCPYYSARHATWLAIGRGRMWARVVDQHKKELPERTALRQTALEQADSIKAFLSEGLDKRVLFPMPLYSDRADPKDCAERSDHFFKLEGAMTNAMLLVQEHAAQIAADCRRISVHGNSLRNAWKAGFASELGYCWTTLTGKLPSLSSSKTNRDFRSFIIAAFASVGGSTAEKWDRVLRTIIHDRSSAPEWDGYDRYEKDRLPPGITFLTRSDGKATVGRKH